MTDALEEELLTIIGLALPGRLILGGGQSEPMGVGSGRSKPMGVGSGGFSSSAATAARRFLSMRYDQLHYALCDDSEKRKKILASDETAVVAVVADALAPLALGIPVITLATLLTRIGLKRLCEGDPFDAGD